MTKQEMKRQQVINKLSDVEVDEVSLVDSPAIGVKFLVVKSEDGTTATQETQETQETVSSVQEDNNPVTTQETPAVSAEANTLPKEEPKQETQETTPKSPEHINQEADKETNLPLNQLPEALSYLEEKKQEFMDYLSRR